MVSLSLCYQYALGSRTGASRLWPGTWSGGFLSNLRILLLRLLTTMAGFVALAANAQVDSTYFQVFTSWANLRRAVQDWAR